MSRTPSRQEALRRLRSPDAYATGDYDHVVTELLDATLGGGAPHAGAGHCHASEARASGTA